MAEMLCPVTKQICNNKFADPIRNDGKFDCSGTDCYYYYTGAVDSNLNSCEDSIYLTLEKVPSPSVTT